LDEVLPGGLGSRAICTALPEIGRLERDGVWTEHVTISGANPPTRLVILSRNLGKGTRVASDVNGLHFADRFGASEVADAWGKIAD
jgi:hypothetical protein